MPEEYEVYCENDDYTCLRSVIWAGGVRKGTVNRQGCLDGSYPE